MRGRRLLAAARRRRRRPPRAAGAPRRTGPVGAGHRRGQGALRRAMKQEAINAALVEHASAGKFVVRLKGGDPYVYGRGFEEVVACVEAGVPVTVVPGISSPIAAPAAAGIPVTHRGVSHEVVIVSGHIRPTTPTPSSTGTHWAACGGTIVLMMAVERLDVFAHALVAGGRDAATRSRSSRTGRCPASDDSPATSRRSGWMLVPPASSPRRSSSSGGSRRSTRDRVTGPRLVVTRQTAHLDSSGITPRVCRVRVASGPCRPFPDVGDRRRRDARLRVAHRRPRGHAAAGRARRHGRRARAAPHP